MNQSNPEQGTLAVAVVDQALPDGKLAVVRLGDRGPLDRLIVVSAVQLNDMILLRAFGEAHYYEQTHPSDVGLVSITLFSDGRKETQSAQNGTSIGTHVPVAERSSGRNTMATEILNRAAGTRPMIVPGVGLARLVTVSR